MRLLHYGDKPFELNRKRRYVAHSDDHKPRGLWVSIEGEQDWAGWCRSENFGCLDHICEVKLAPTANILLIDNFTKLREFNDKYSDGSDRCGSIPWTLFRGQYDGVIIAPYQWEGRNRWMWYYTWDCASGCIWNLSAIASALPIAAEVAA